MISSWRIYSSNSRRFTSFHVPTKSTNGQFACFSMASILSIPMRLYSAASFIVSIILRWIGTCALACAHIGVTAPLQWRSHVKFRSLSLIMVFPPVLRMRRKTVEQSASNVANGSSVDFKSCFGLSLNCPFAFWGRIHKSKYMGKLDIIGRWC